MSKSIIGGYWGGSNALRRDEICLVISAADTHRCEILQSGGENLTSPVSEINFMKKQWDVALIFPR